MDAADIQCLPRFGALAVKSRGGAGALESAGSEGFRRTERARGKDLLPLDKVRPTVEQILHTAAAAKLLDALEDNLLLAPIQSSVVPLPHQLYALNRALSRDLEFVELL